LTTYLLGRFQNSAFIVARNIESVLVEAINDDYSATSKRDILAFVHNGDDI